MTALMPLDDAMLLQHRRVLEAGLGAQVLHRDRRPDLQRVARL